MTYLKALLTAIQSGAEVWKPAVGLEHLYMVSNQGNVINVRTGRRLNMKAGTRGYKRIQVYCGGRKTMVSVHRMVANAFVPNPHGYATVNHIDGCKTNNSADNLEWCTEDHNKLHAVVINKGSGQKVSLDGMKHIYAHRNGPLTATEIAFFYGITRGRVREIMTLRHCRALSSALAAMLKGEE